MAFIDRGGGRPVASAHGLLLSPCRDSEADIGALGAGRWRLETRPRAVSLQCLQLEGCSISFKVSPHIERFDRITLQCDISRNVAVWPNRCLRDIVYLMSR